MLFPLLLSLSQRVAALLSSAMLGLIALVATLLFAKKAFLLSAAALAIAAWDANRKKSQPAPEIHVHRIPVYHKEYYPEHHETHEELYKADYSPESDYATASQSYGVGQSYSSTSQNYGNTNQNYGNANQNYGGDSQHYGSASQKYNVLDKSPSQQFSPTYGIADKSHQFYGITDKAPQFYGQATRDNISQLPYRSYRYRKGRG